MTFYLKYRSQTLDELDLESVRETLKKIVSFGKIPHAFLFAGPKGTGKTSAARIIAKIVNCENPPAGGEPCNKCEQCLTIAKGTNLDVIEMDAASNRGIDDVRALRDAVKLAPAWARKKVYIIDEAHMLTTEASNALLKTLEEPPSHVMFILATTNPEKLIETIRSRATLVNFPKATPEEILRSLSRIVKGEKLKIDKETLLLIAKEAHGSFRDATKILEQVISNPDYLSKVKIFNADDFLDVLTKKDIQKALHSIEEFVNKGVGVENLIESLLLRLRKALLAKVGIGKEDLPSFSKDDLVCLIELLSKASREISTSPIEQLPLELAVVEWCGDIVVEGNPKLVNRDPACAARSRPEPRANLKEIGEDVWKNILAQIKTINTSIEALLRAAKPISFDGKILTLGVYYKFHKERLEEGAHRRVLEDVVAGVLGNPVKVVCTLTEPPVKNVTPPLASSGETLTESKDQDIIKIAEEIFGN